jgi:hypothetical protein
VPTPLLSHTILIPNGAADTFSFRLAPCGLVGQSREESPFSLFLRRLARYHLSANRTCFPAKCQMEQHEFGFEEILRGGSS